MNKPMTAAFLILASGLTLSTTALAEPFTHGSAYVNAVIQAHTRPQVQSVQTHSRVAVAAAASGFNDRETVGDKTSAVNAVTGIETAVSKMLSSIASGFNDRG